MTPCDLPTPAAASGTSPREPWKPRARGKDLLHPERPLVLRLILTERNGPLLGTATVANIGGVNGVCDYHAETPEDPDEEELP